jgi:hypothetical protein
MDNPDISAALNWLHWLTILRNVGAGLVLLGVAFEFGGDWFSEPFQKKIDAARELQLAQLTKEASKLSADAESARAAIAKSEAETARANEIAAKANERTAELKLALEREVAARQPRTISPEQRVAIQQYLQNISPKEEIVVVWKLWDEEAEQFGKLIISALKDAGFDAKQGQGPATFGNKGQWIVVANLGKYSGKPSAVGAIQGAFRDILKLEFPGNQKDPSWPDLGEVVIAIGAKAP